MKMMAGTSTKLTATGFALAVQGLAFYGLFEAVWGPMWTAPPATIGIWVAGVVATLIGWFVPEKAFAPETSAE